MNSRRSSTVSSLSIATLALLVATAVPAASHLGVQSRLSLGPSLNKDVPAASPAPAAPASNTMTAPAVIAAPPTVNLPPRTVNQPAPLPGPTATSPPSSTNVHPTFPTPPSVQEKQRQEQFHLQQQMPVHPKPNAMERAGQMVRSVIQKIDPNRPHVSVHRSDGGIDLSRGQSINHPTHITTTAGAAASDAATASVSATGAAAGNAPAQSRSLSGATGASSKQEKRVNNQNPGREAQQTQRGMLNDQKMNVGVTNQQ